MIQAEIFSIIFSRNIGYLTKKCKGTQDIFFHQIIVGIKFSKKRKEKKGKERKRNMFLRKVKKLPKFRRNIRKTLEHFFCGSEQP